MKNKLFLFWEKGYLYLFICFLLFLIFAINDHVGIYDWRKEIAFFQYIKSSFVDFHSFPWFWWNKLETISKYPAVAATSSFISNPETMVFSPFTPMLFFLDVLPFIKIFAISHCLIGITGSLALKKRMKWSSQQFRVFSILFLLSPIIIQHLAIGYTPWLNLFFFPWLMVFIFEKKPLLSIYGASIILALILLQGGTHIFIWFFVFVSIFMVLKMLLERKWDYRLPGIILITPLLSFARIYSTALSYNDFHQFFLPGYKLINFIFWAIIPPVLIPPVDSFFMKKVLLGIPSWDAGIFWGLAIILVFILAKNFVRYNRSEDLSPGIKNTNKALFITSSILFVLSFFSIFSFIVTRVNSVLHIPFIEGAEKYPFRLAIPAYFGFSILLPTYWKPLSQSIINFCSPLRKYLRVFKYFGLSLFAGASVVLVSSMIFQQTILDIVRGIIRQAYSERGFSWLSQMMPGKGTSPLEGYYARAEAIYPKLQATLLVVVLAFLIFTELLLIIVRLPKGCQRRKEYGMEFFLAGPLVFASFMWLSLSISVPYSRFPEQKILPPLVEISSKDVKLDLSADPQRVTIVPQQGSQAVEIIFQKISPADMNNLKVITNNAVLHNQNGVLSLTAQEDQPITIEFNTSRFTAAMIITAAAWVAALVSFFVECRSKWLRTHVFIHRKHE